MTITRTSSPRTDRGGLAAPKTATIFEGVAARAHVKGDGLRYADPTADGGIRYEYREVGELKRIADQFAGGTIPVTLDHGGPVVGRIIGGRVDVDRVVASMLITDADAARMINAGERVELSMGYTTATDRYNYQRGIQVYELSLVSRARCGPQCSIERGDEDVPLAGQRVAVDRQAEHCSCGGPCCTSTTPTTVESAMARIGELEQAIARADAKRADAERTRTRIDAIKAQAEAARERAAALEAEIAEAHRRTDAAAERLDAIHAARALALVAKYERERPRFLGVLAQLDATPSLPSVRLDALARVVLVELERAAGRTQLREQIRHLRQAAEHLDHAIAERRADAYGIDEDTAELGRRVPGLNLIAAARTAVAKYHDEGAARWTRRPWN